MYLYSKNQNKDDLSKSNNFLSDSSLIYKGTYFTRILDVLTFTYTIVNTYKRQLCRKTKYAATINQNFRRKI